MILDLKGAGQVHGEITQHPLKTDLLHVHRAHDRAANESAVQEALCLNAKKVGVLTGPD